MKRKIKNVVQVLPVMIYILSIWYGGFMDLPWYIAVVHTVYIGGALLFLAFATNETHKVKVQVQSEEARVCLVKNTTYLSNVERIQIRKDLKMNEKIIEIVERFRDEFMISYLIYLTGLTLISPQSISFWYKIALSFTGLLIVTSIIMFSRIGSDTKKIESDKNVVIVFLIAISLFGMHFVLSIIQVLPLLK